MILARLNSNGSYDNTYSVDGIRVIDFGGGEDFARETLLQPDGKIVVAGSTTRSNDRRAVALLRLLPNGNPDSSFDGDGKAVFSYDLNLEGQAAAIQLDGKIVVAGWVEVDAPSGQNNKGRFLARFNPDGSIDTAFGDNGLSLDLFVTESSDLSIEITDLALEAGRFVVVGQYSDSNHAWGEAHRYNSDGSHERELTGPLADPECASAGCQDFYGGVVIQPDGKIVISGARSTVDDPASDQVTQMFHLLRFNPGGVLDASFVENGSVETVVPQPSGRAKKNGAWDVALQPNGKILAAGFSEQGKEAELDFAVARYLPNGDIDDTFGVNGYSFVFGHPEEIATSVGLQPDGRIVLTGWAEFGGKVARLLNASVTSADPPVQVILPLVFR